MFLFWYKNEYLQIRKKLTDNKNVNLSDFEHTISFFIEATDQLNHFLYPTHHNKLPTYLLTNAYDALVCQNKSSIEEMEAILDFIENESNYELQQSLHQLQGYAQLIGGMILLTQRSLFHTPFALLFLINASETLYCNHQLIIHNTSNHIRSFIRLLKEQTDILSFSPEL